MPGSSKRTTASSPSLTISAAGVKSPATGRYQSVVAAGPKKSRSQRSQGSTSHTGRDHNARLFMVIPSCFVVS
ncbi:Uncharacterised protein [Mycobacterium tuberculosis]|uniref:Uncharacterized protein n=1 Tax=Mycobacterium tuberculosis TaxID=1773 RepID=A0A655IKR7_MYCTX|nr:Uncharacterised protein [Mycobacterium tuberculosis]